MPWTAGYQTTVIGLREAALVKVQTVLVAKIADLNTALQLSPLTTPVLPVGTATSANIIIGDPATFTAATKFIVCITGGGKLDGSDIETEMRYIDGAGISPSSLRQFVHTNIGVYIHPDVFPQGAPSTAAGSWTNVLTQAEYRERFRARVCDWIRADCFQTAAGVDMMALASQETRSDGDNLSMGTIMSIRSGYFNKGLNGDWSVYGSHIHVRHWLN